MSDHDLDVCAHLVRIAHAFRGRSETRYYLKGVRIEPHPSAGVYIVATCGASMLVLHDPEGRAARPVTVRLRKLVRKSFPKRGLYRLVMTLPTVEEGDLEAVHSASIVRGTNMDKAVTVAVETDAEILGFYPEWRKIVGLMAKALDEQSSFSECHPVAGDNLRRFGKAAVELATLVRGAPFARDTAIRLRSGSGTDDPILVHYDESLRAFGMVARLVTGDEATPPVLPAWAGGWPPDPDFTEEPAS